MEILQNFWNLMTTPNEKVVALISIPCLFIETYIYMKLFTTILDIKTTKKKEIIFVISLSVFGSIVNILHANFIGSAVNMLLFPILVFIIFKCGVIKSILAEILPILISYLIEMILINFLNLFSINYTQIQTLPLCRIICITFIYSALYFIYKLLKKYNVTLKIPDKLHLNKKFIFITTLCCGLFSLGLQIYLYINYRNILPMTFIIINLFALVLYFVLTFYSISGTYKLYITSTNLEEAQLYNKTLTILHDNIRAFKHDFNNIINAIGGYVQTDDMAGLKKYYSQLQKDCIANNNLTALSPSVINNPAVYNVLANKYYIADEYGININLEVFFDLNTLNMKIYEFTRILGILMDNAIEAAKDCEDKTIYLIMRNDSSRNRQLLIIENTYNNKDIDTDKIYEKGFSTKENNTGLGLWEVRQILNKNKNLNLYTSKNNEYFNQQLEIYLK